MKHLCGSICVALNWNCYIYLFSTMCVHVSSEVCKYTDGAWIGIRGWMLTVDSQRKKSADACLEMNGRLSNWLLLLKLFKSSVMMNFRSTYTWPIFVLKCQNFKINLCVSNSEMNNVHVCLHRTTPGVHRQLWRRWSKWRLRSQTAWLTLMPRSLSTETWQPGTVWWQKTTPSRLEVLKFFSCSSYFNSSPSHVVLCHGWIVVTECVCLPGRLRYDSRHLWDRLLP